LISLLAHEAERKEDTVWDGCLNYFARDEDCGYTMKLEITRWEIDIGKQEDTACSEKDFIF
jgi:hypothetical protein